jgi:hypothetical protein
MKTQNPFTHRRYFRHGTTSSEVTNAPWADAF